MSTGLTGQAAEERRERIFAETREALEKSGITLDLLIANLKRELKAQVTKTAKFKGKLELDEHGKPKTMRGVRIIAQGDKRECDKAGTLYDDGDTVIAWNETAWEIRQKARQDAHKLRGDYPAEKHDHSGGIDLTIRDCVKEAAGG